MESGEFEWVGSVNGGKIGVGVATDDAEAAAEWVGRGWVMDGFRCREIGVVGGGREGWVVEWFG